MTRRRGDDRGFTLVELIVTVTILGIIIIPISNFVLQYFQTYPQTENRISDSHDLQIATAYLSNDVASAGVNTSDASPTGAQSVWTTAFPAGYCGQSSGTTVLLLSWNTWTVASGTGNSGATSSVAYVKRSGALHRVYCASGTSTTSDVTIVHGLDSATASCPGGCGSSPSTVQLTLGISTGATDSAAITSVTLTGKRRPS